MAVDLALALVSMTKTSKKALVLVHMIIHHEYLTKLKLTVVQIQTVVAVVAVMAVVSVPQRKTHRHQLCASMTAAPRQVIVVPPQNCHKCQLEELCSPTCFPFTWRGLVEFFAICCDLFEKFSFAPKVYKYL